jgi:hypothetical protein
MGFRSPGGWHHKCILNPVMEKDLSQKRSEDDPFVSFLKEIETKQPPSKEEPFSLTGDTSFSSAFLIELVHRIKNTLGSIKNLTLLAVDKFDDVEFRRYALQSVAGDVRKIDSVLNSLLNYIHINTPLIKINTIPLLLESILDANMKQLQDKKIQIIKRFWRDLPETSIHDEQVRFILNSVLQYAILSTSVNGTIGILIKGSNFQKGMTDRKVSPEKDGGYIEVAVGFAGDKKSGGQSKGLSEVSDNRKGEAIDLILKLVKEILQKNHGMMTLHIDPKKLGTLITLKFPIERRKVIYYEPITI